MKSNFKNEIQTFGRSLLLPIAVLAPVGMLMGICSALGQAYTGVAYLSSDAQYESVAAAVNLVVPPLMNHLFKEITNVIGASPLVGVTVKLTVPLPTASSAVNVTLPAASTDTHSLSTSYV